MRDRKKRNIMIASLCCLLVFMGIGYALLTQILTISGTATLTGDWRIEITNITTKEVVGTAKNTVDDLGNPTSPTFDKDSATFSVDFFKPGDKIVYEVTVENFGSIDAVLSLDTDSSVGTKDIKFTNTLTSGSILKAGESTTFDVEAKFSENATTIETGQMSIYKIVLIYTQYDGNQLYDPSNTITDNGVFKVESGTITDYNAELGTHVSIPAEIDNVPVTSISSDAFKEVTTTYNYDLKVALADGGTPQFAIIFNEDVRDELMALTGGMVPAYGVGDSNIPELSDGVIYGYYNYSEDLLSTSPILESDSDFLGESSTTKTLLIKSLDLSNATNLEYIGDYAFSNASADMTEEEIKNMETGLTSLTLGNNTNQIKVGLGAFSGADLKELKIYQGSIYSDLTDEDINNISGDEDTGMPEVLAVAGLADITLFKKAFPFGGASIDSLVLMPSSAVTSVNTNMSFVGINDIGELYINSGIEDLSIMVSGATIDNISLPNDLKSISGAFSGVKTSKLVIPSSVTSITGGFLYMNITDSLDINASIPSIASTSLTAGFGGLKTNVLNLNSSTLTSIDERAFSGSTINTVNISSSVTTIGKEAFKGLSSSSVINIKRGSSTGMTLGNAWNGSAKVNYIG